MASASIPPRPSPQVIGEGVIGFIWQQFGAYHMDRCEAAGEAFGDPSRVVGIELATYSDLYPWEPSGEAVHFTKVTLFPGGTVERLGIWTTYRAVARAIRHHAIRHLLIAGYELPALALIAVRARLSGVRVYVALDSKFDDKPRSLRRELFKHLLMLPYHGGLASGRRAAEYLRFLGLRRRPVALGYDTVSLDRLRALAIEPPAWEERPFLVVARFVPKKNLAAALQAYAFYYALAPTNRRRLHLYGAGPLDVELRAAAEFLGIAGQVDFLGFGTQAAIAAGLSEALCLMLPSTQEQWGLVVNEALAFGLPLLVSNTVGACDLLAGTWSNGFVMDPDDTAAWGGAMAELGGNRALWEKLHAGSKRRAPMADVSAFVSGVTALLARPQAHCA